MTLKNVDIVIGMSYGDEGKGHVTDYLVNTANAHTAVVRFNSGAQAGHTVEANGMKHVFQHFGSGSFLGAPTILSRFFVVNPVLFFKEAEKLAPLCGNDLMVFVDPSCEVTTPYDVFINQAVERSRSKERHGSCGVGFGETIERGAQGYNMLVSDLSSAENIKSALHEIKTHYLLARIEQLGLDPNIINDPLLATAEERFVHDALEFVQVTEVLHDKTAMELFDHLVFEGAQGLRLDQASKDFPHVTRSSTGLENVAYLLHNVDAHINVHYLTRSYLTRHGAGPLDNEVSNPGVTDGTNIKNEFQGKLRFAELDFARMKSDVTHDKQFLTHATANHTVKYTAVITCCDQYELFNSGNIKELTNKVAKTVGANDVLESWGPNRNDFTRT